jgi:hypothetical protein
MRRRILPILTGLTLLLGGASASATPITLNLTYSGASFGNGATGTGTITLDDALIPNPGLVANVPAATLGITAFSITISGASSGNGTFGLADVTNWVWFSTQPLNLTQELVGQAHFHDFNWCSISFLPCTPPAPGGAIPFVIRTNAETGDQLLLTSMVPEPSTTLLLACGLVGLGVRRLH